MSDNIPKHIAILPDGSTQWAKKNGLKPWKGHEFGSVVFGAIAQDIFRLGVRSLSVWASSRGDWETKPAILLSSIKSKLILKNKILQLQN